MMAIVTAWDTKHEQKLEATGYRKETVYIKEVGRQKELTEGSLMRIGVFQFLVSDYWGAGPD